MLAIERGRSAARQESDTLTSSVLMAGAAGHSQAVHLLVTLSRVGPAPPVRIVMPGHGAAFRHSASAAAGHCSFPLRPSWVVWSVCLLECGFCFGQRLIAPTANRVHVARCMLRQEYDSSTSRHAPTRSHLGSYPLSTFPPVVPSAAAISPRAVETASPSTSPSRRSLTVIVDSHMRSAHRRVPAAHAAAGAAHSTRARP